jgi:alpha/beta superfamily hydrolase
VPLALVGYSFGCTLLPAATPENCPAVLVLIAPTIDAHDLDPVARLPQPKLVIAPRDDFAAKERRLTEWLTGLAPPREILRPRLDGHFFRGHEDWLVDTVSQFLDRQWGI